MKNLLHSNDEIKFQFWQKTYHYCRVHHEHFADALKIVLDDSLENTETKSIKENENVRETSYEQRCDDKSLIVNDWRGMIYIFSWSIYVQEKLR
jgi:hypothetical protein